MNLRDYQAEAVEAVRVGFRTTGKRQVLMLPTAAGKTHISSYMIEQASKKGMRCLFVADRIELIDQTSSRFYNDGIEHGVIQANHPWFFPELNVQICSIQTLARRKVEKFDLLIIDECHSLFRAHIDLMNANDGFVVGLSATPFTKGLGKYFDGLVKPITARRLIEKGFLSKYEAYGPDTIDLSGVKTIAGDFDVNEVGVRIDKPKLVANVVDTWFKRAKGLKTICFATNIAHSKHLAREFTRRGVSALHIDCYTGKESSDERLVRKDIFSKYRCGEITVLCNVDLATKGLDVPDIACVIQGRPTKSLMIHDQQIGRGLRISPGKDGLIILDHAGNHERLGFIDGPRPDALDGGERKSCSQKKKEREREEPMPKRCPSCDFLKPAGMRKCPACGLVAEFAEDVATAKGELKKLERKEYTLAEKQAFLGGLNSHYADVYAKKGWPVKHGCFGPAIKLYEKKFGCKPSNKIDWSYKCEISEEVKKYITADRIRWAKSKEKREKAIAA